MPNQYQNTWAKTPGLHERAVALRGERKFPREIARILSAEFAMNLTEANVDSHLKRSPELVDAGKGVRLPRELIEPKDGYAVPFVPPKPKHPTGWEPSVEIEDGKGKVIFCSGTEKDVEDARILEGSQLDPARYRIVGPRKFKKWTTSAAVRDANGMFLHWDTIWNYYHAVEIVEVDPTDRKVDVSVLIKDFFRIKPPRAKPPTGESAYVLNIADTQVGKCDMGGIEWTERQFADGVERGKDHIRDLRRSGVALGPLYIFGLGDLIENCSGYYDSQEFGAQLNKRDQVKVARRMVLRTIRELAPLFERVVVAAVPGNHGQNRGRGAGQKSYTTPGDNVDIEIFEVAEEVTSENPDAFGHVRYVIPKDEITVTLDVCGTTVGLLHGDQISGGDAVKATRTFLQKQSYGGQPIGQAQVYFKGHLHHYFSINDGERTLFQAPALEGGSESYRNYAGLQSARGLLAMCIGKDLGAPVRDGLRLGWDHARIL